MPSTDSNVRKQKYDTGVTLGRPSPRSIFFPYPYGDSTRATLFPRKRAL